MLSEAGSSPRRASFFLVAPRKKPKMRLEYLPHNSLRAWGAPFKQTRQVRRVKACQCAAVLRLARECTIVAVLSMVSSESGDSMHALRALGIDRTTCFLVQFDGIAPLRVEMRHLLELMWQKLGI